ncbi:MAG: hypothetical protein ACI94Y_000687 [Maribacter sp.]|jgi:hypothetical protein
MPTSIDETVIIEQNENDGSGITEIDTSLLVIQDIIPIENRKFSIIQIIKEPCYGGGYPVYEFSLLNDGVAFYNCKTECSPRSGQYYAYIGREKAGEILAYINNYNLMNLNSVYPMNGRSVANIPLTQINISTDDKRTKKIKNYHHAPQVLLELEDIVTQIVMDTNWEPTYE